MWPATDSLDHEARWGYCSYHTVIGFSDFFFELGILLEITLGNHSLLDWSQQNQKEAGTYAPTHVLQITLGLSWISLCIGKCHPTGSCLVILGFPNRKAEPKQGRSSVRRYQFPYKHDNSFKLCSFSSGWIKRYCFIVSECFKIKV